MFRKVVLPVLLLSLFFVGNVHASSNCSAVLSNDFSLSVPVLNFQGQYFWANFQYIPGTATFALSGAGLVADATPYGNCTPSTISDSFVLHMPEVIFSGSSYWLDLQYSNGIFAATGVGQNPAPSGNNNSIVGKWLWVNDFIPSILGGTAAIYYTFGADGILTAYGEINSPYGSGTCTDQGTYSISGNVLSVAGFGAPVATGDLAGHCDLGSPVNGVFGTFTVSGDTLTIDANYNSQALELIFSRQ